MLHENQIGPLRTNPILTRWSWTEAGEFSDLNELRGAPKADTLLCLPCLTNCLTCWCTPPPAQTESCCKGPWRPLQGNPKLRGPGSTNSPLTQESLSVGLPGNSICLSSCAGLTTPENEHTLHDRAAHLKRGLGAAENATQSLLCVNGTKRPVRLEEREWDKQNPADDLGNNKPGAGNGVSGYTFSPGAWTRPG